MEIEQATKRERSIYEDVTEFIKLESIDMSEVYSDDVRDLVFRVVLDLDNGLYPITDFIDNPDYAAWFENVIKDDYEDAAEMSYQDAIYFRELLLNYVKDRYMDGAYSEEEEYWDDEGEV